MLALFTAEKRAEDLPEPLQAEPPGRVDEPLANVAARKREDVEGEHAETIGELLDRLDVRTDEARAPRWRGDPSTRFRSARRGSGS
jgi:hypothetical protein